MDQVLAPGSDAPVQATPGPGSRSASNLRLTVDSATCAEYLASSLLRDRMSQIRPHGILDQSCYQ